MNVTEENIEINKEVVPGPDWTGGDKKSYGIGVIMTNYDDGWVQVRWNKTGELQDHQVGHDGKYELHYAGD